MNPFADLSRGERRFLWVVFAIAWVLRIAFAVEYERRHPLADRPVIDEASYESWALEIAEGDLLGDEPFFQEPLYAYWLGGVYTLFQPADSAYQSGGLESRRTAARHLQAMLGALTVVLIYLLTRRVFGPLPAAVSGLAAATYRPLLILPSYLLKPNLFLPLFVGLVLLLYSTSLARSWRGRGFDRWLAVGVLCGLGTLLRGNMLVLLPAFLALPLLRVALERRKEASAARESPFPSLVGMALGMGLVLLPVALRNLAVGGVFAPTTTGAGTNVYGGNHPENPHGRASEVSWIRGIPEHEADDWRREAERRAGRPMDAGEVSDYWLRETLRSVASSPGRHISILWNKLRLALGRYEVPDNHHLEWDARHLLLLSLPFPGYETWGWLGLAGMLAFLSRREWRPGLPSRRDAVGLMLLYTLYLATIVATVMSMRIRLALVPLLLPFAGLFVVAAPGFPRRALGRALGAAGTSSTLRPATWLASLAVAAVPVFVPVLGASEVEEDLAKRDFNHVVYLLEDGDVPEAEALVAKLVGRYGPTARLVTLRAELVHARVRPVLEAPDATEAETVAALAELGEALADLRAVVEDPDVGARERFRARKLAGLVQLGLGSPSAAERHLREAARFDGEDPVVRLALANALYLCAIDAPDDTGAPERLRESRDLLEELFAEEPSGDLERRLELVRAVLAR